MSKMCILKEITYVGIQDVNITIKMNVGVVCDMIKGNEFGVANISLLLLYSFPWVMMQFSKKITFEFHNNQ